MEQNKQEGGAAGVVSTRTVETVVAVILFALGAVVSYTSYQLGSGWGSDGPGAGYFPFYIGIILMVSAAGVLYQSLKGKLKNGAEAFVDREQLGRVLSVLLPAVIYVLAVQLIGIYIASAVYIALFMIKLGKYSTLRSFALGVAVMVVFFLMFEVWFKVPLYKGMFNPLAFLGY